LKGLKSFSKVVVAGPMLPEKINIKQPPTDPMQDERRNIEQMKGATNLT
jgi:hypothetical protein